MKMTKKRTGMCKSVITLSAAPLLAAALWTTAPTTAARAQTGTAPKTTAKPKVERPKSRTAQGTVANVSATSLRATVKDGPWDVTLTPQTEVWRVDSDLAANELKVGDTVMFTLRGTNGLPTVQSLSPMTLKFAEQATLTFGNTNKMTFDRISKMATTELAAGQTAKVAANVFADGKNEARTVWAIFEKPKPAKAAAE